uniref:Uncharacterized protein n=1 Tax=Rhizophora mucronata TaxID=61149 RepID=A0A2P2NCM3_RHIMU
MQTVVGAAISVNKISLKVESNHSYSSTNSSNLS